jgi:hypothetical protein
LDLSLPWVLPLKTLNEIRISSAADSNPANAVIDALQKSYDATTDFVADFRQEPKSKPLTAP